MTAIRHMTPGGAAESVRQAVRRLLGRFGFQIIRTSSLHAFDHPPDFQEDDIEIIDAVAKYTMTTRERVYALIRSVEYVVRERIPGDIVECGVWRGGSMMAAAKVLIRCGDVSRTLFLFDTYDGMPPPSQHDRDCWGEEAEHLLARSQRMGRTVWAAAGLAEVRANMESTGYPSERIAYVKGRVEDTIPIEAPQRISVLRLDTDWYESTLHELEHLFPRLSPGGILIVDDYGHWAGSRRAVEEYICSNHVRLFLSRIDYSARIGVKQLERELHVQR